MKMFVVAYNEALDEEVVNMLKAVGVEGWTKWTKVFGQGASSGPHLGTHIWPKANNVLAAVIDDRTAKQLIKDVRSMRERLAKEGVKAFLLPCEEIT